MSVLNWAYEVYVSTGLVAYPAWTGVFTRLAQLP